MGSNFEMYPWNRLALIAYIVKKHKSMFPNVQLGKTSIQKLIYLFKEHFDVPLGYRFRFYNYGPFSNSISQDIETLDSFEVINLDTSADVGYDLSINKDSAFSKLEQKAALFIEKNKDNLDEVIQCFGKSNAKTLELYATIVWVNRELAQNQFDKNTIEQDIEKNVKKLKPKYSDDEIFKGIDFLKKHDYLLLNP
ncbi:MAG: hypothetical protein IJH67_09005 [Thermoguttaceae bacterium]|nr:hypothetical protein [Thermoguttaceae bacterium]